MKKTLPIFLLAIISLPAMADAGQFRAGLRFGDKLDGRLPNTPFGTKTKSPFGATGSYQFTDVFGVEVGFSDLGKSSAVPIADFGFDLDGTLWNIGLTANVALDERWSLFGAAGAFNLREDGLFSGIAGPRPFDNNDSGVYAEIGGRFAVTEQLDIRASYQHFNFDESADGTPWLGLEAKF